MTSSSTSRNNCGGFIKDLTLQDVSHESPPVCSSVQSVLDKLSVFKATLNTMSLSLQGFDPVQIFNRCYERMKKIHHVKVQFVYSSRMCKGKRKFELTANNIVVADGRFNVMRLSNEEKQAYKQWTYATFLSHIDSSDYSIVWNVKEKRYHMTSNSHSVSDCSFLTSTLEKYQIRKKRMDLFTSDDCVPAVDGRCVCSKQSCKRIKQACAVSSTGCVCLNEPQNISEPDFIPINTSLSRASRVNSGSKSYQQIKVQNKSVESEPKRKVAEDKDDISYNNECSTRHDSSTHNSSVSVQSASSQQNPSNHQKSSRSSYTLISSCFWLIDSKSQFQWDKIVVKLNSLIRLYRLNYSSGISAKTMFERACKDNTLVKLNTRFNQRAGGKFESLLSIDGLTLARGYAYNEHDAAESAYRQLLKRLIQFFSCYSKCNFYSCKSHTNLDDCFEVESKEKRKIKDSLVSAESRSVTDQNDTSRNCDTSESTSALRTSGTDQLMYCDNSTSSDHQIVSDSHKTSSLSSCSYDNISATLSCFSSLNKRKKFKLDKIRSLTSKLKSLVTYYRIECTFEPRLKKRIVFRRVCKSNFIVRVKKEIRESGDRTQCVLSVGGLTLARSVCHGKCKAVRSAHRKLLKRLMTFFKKCSTCSFYKCTIHKNATDCLPSYVTTDRSADVLPASCDTLTALNIDPTSESNEHNKSVESAPKRKVAQDKDGISYNNECSTRDISSAHSTSVHTLVQSASSQQNLSDHQKSSRTSYTLISSCFECIKSDSKFQWDLIVKKLESLLRSYRLDYLAGSRFPVEKMFKRACKQNARVKLQTRFNQQAGGKFECVLSINGVPLARGYSNMKLLAASRAYGQFLKCLIKFFRYFSKCNFYYCRRHKNSEDCFEVECKEKRECNVSHQSHNSSRCADHTSHNSDTGDGPASSNQQSQSDSLTFFSHSDYNASALLSCFGPLNENKKFKLDELRTITSKLECLVGYYRLECYYRPRMNADTVLRRVCKSNAVVKVDKEMKKIGDRVECTLLIDQLILSRSLCYVKRDAVRNAHRKLENRLIKFFHKYSSCSFYKCMIHKNMDECFPSDVTINRLTLSLSTNSNMSKALIIESASESNVKSKSKERKRQREMVQDEVSIKQETQVEEEEEVRESKKKKIKLVEVKVEYDATDTKELNQELVQSNDSGLTESSVTHSSALSSPNDDRGVIIKHERSTVRKLSFQYIFFNQFYAALFSDPDTSDKSCITSSQSCDVLKSRMNSLSELYRTVVGTNNEQYMSRFCASYAETCLKVAADYISSDIQVNFVLTSDGRYCSTAVIDGCVYGGTCMCTSTSDKTAVLLMARTLLHGKFSLVACGAGYNLVNNDKEERGSSCMRFMTQSVSDSGLSLDEMLNCVVTFQTDSDNDPCSILEQTIQFSRLKSYIEVKSLKFTTEYVYWLEGERLASVACKTGADGRSLLARRVLNILRCKRCPTVIVKHNVAYPSLFMYDLNKINRIVNHTCRGNSRIVSHKSDSVLMFPYNTDVAQRSLVTDRSRAIDERSPVSHRSRCVDERSPVSHRSRCVDERSPVSHRSRCVDERSPVSHKSRCVDERSPVSHRSRCVDERSPLSHRSRCVDERSLMSGSLEDFTTVVDRLIGLTLLVPSVKEDLVFGPLSTFTSDHLRIISSMLSKHHLTAWRYSYQADDGSQDDCLVVPVIRSPLKLVEYLRSRNGSNYAYDLIEPTEYFKTE